MYTQHIIMDLEMNPVAENNKKHGLENEIIEIGAVKLNSNLEITDRFNMYIKPQFNASITPYIRRLTGITNYDVYQQPYFDEAFKKFSEWVGFNYNTRIYTWSDNDLKVLLSECSVKSVEIPANMKRWLNFQAIYPRMMGISSGHNPMALRKAAAHYGITMDNKKAHNALYDAEITMELLIPVLNGTYKRQLSILNSASSYSSNYGRNTLGDICGGALHKLLNEMKLEMAV